MKASVVVTVKDEEESISHLLDGLFDQTKKVDEIVIVDGGSRDKTVSIIKHYQKRFGKIKILEEKCSRSKGRNLGIEIARNEIIALTDAGCIPKKDWLKKITSPFLVLQVDVVAGFYEMVAKSNFQKALSIFLGVTPRRFNANFLPSARSMAFRKKVWEELGGFPEKMKNTAEDTLFNIKILMANKKMARVKNARVEWGMPETIKKAFDKFFAYAKGDAQTKVFFHPTKKIASHNIKAGSIILRYVFGMIFLILGAFRPLFWWILGIGLILYMLWSFRKVYIEFRETNIAVWGIFIQFLSDIAVMEGFVSGIFN